MSPIFNPSPPVAPQPVADFPGLPESMSELDYDEWHAHIADSDGSMSAAASQPGPLPSQSQPEHEAAPAS